ncbi:MAG: alkaline phosphatase family protein, partial [Chloroflexi bacterium]|nr:alkaline phosphatase family protein [Chloroflexota bacterium]
MKIKMFRIVLVVGLLLSALSVPAFAARVTASGNAAPAVASPSGAHGGDDRESVIFFAADGLRQDLVEAYASQHLLPTMGRLLRTGAKAADGGLLTQAPPNTGAGWYSLATGAWPGVHGSTNNTFFINGQVFSTTRTAAFDPGVLQAETLAQAAERGGKKVAQIEWAGGRNGVING